MILKKWQAEDGEEVPTYEQVGDLIPHPSESPGAVRPTPPLKCTRRELRLHPSLHPSHTLRTSTLLLRALWPRSSCGLVLLDGDHHCYGWFEAMP